MTVQPPEQYLEDVLDDIFLVVLREAQPPKLAKEIPALAILTDDVLPGGESGRFAWRNRRTGGSACAVP